MKLAAWMSLMLVMSLFLFTRAVESAKSIQSAQSTQKRVGASDKRPMRVSLWAVVITTIFLIGFTSLLWIMEHPIE